MDFDTSTIRVHDLNELESLGFLDAAIENAATRRHSSIEISSAEADEVHGGLAVSDRYTMPGYFPIVPPCIITGRIAVLGPTM